MRKKKKKRGEGDKRRERRRHVGGETRQEKREEKRREERSATHAPPGDCQAAAVDEGPFGSTNSRGNNGGFNGAWLDRHGIRPSYLGLGARLFWVCGSVLRGRSRNSTHC